MWKFELLWTLAVFSLGTNGEGVNISGTIEKPPLDRKEYRGLTLSNRLEVLLISDANATKAAASLTIGVGSLSNPPDIPGLAHFVQNAVALGSEKYPEVNELSKYLGANGGSENARTEEDKTTFFFDVAPFAFKGALDRLCHHFVSPTFRESTLEKEVSAINSENEKKIPSDSSRIFRVEQETANKSHEFSRFFIGNRETLWTLPKARGVNMSEELGKFFDKFYSANLMRLAVLGSESLDDLQKTVEEIFKVIPDKKVELPVWNNPPYGNEELQRWIRIVPRQDLRTLYLTVPLPYSASTYKTNPLGYIASLLGHEGKGSVLSVLRKRNLATELGMDVVEHRGFTAMQIEVSLTSEGLNNTEEVVCLLFRYVDMLRSEGPQEWYWRELQAALDIKYRFQEKSDATSLLVLYSTKMLTYPLEEVVTAGILLKEYIASDISELLSHITPQRVRVTLVSKTFEPTANLTEKYYGVKYSTDKIDSAVIKRWGECRKVDDLHLPKKNEFIPSKFDLKDRVETPGIVPKVLKETQLSRVWFVQDSEFLLPKAVVSLDMFSPEAYRSPASVWLGHLMTEIVDKALDGEYYEAYLADLSYSLESFPYGIRVKVRGFNDKLDVLLYKIVDTFTSFNFSNVDTSIFDAAKDSFYREILNSPGNQPLTKASKFLAVLLRDKYWTRDDLISVAEDITIESLEEFARNFFSRLHLTWIFYGNVGRNESLRVAEEITALFKQTQPLFPSQIQRLRDVEIPEGTNWIYEMKTSEASSSAISLLYQLEPLKDTRGVVMASLLRQLTQAPFYDTLRTREQLGFIVGTNTRALEATNAFEFVVQGERHPAYVASRVAAFIASFGGTLANMTEETFKGHKEAFRAVLAESKPSKQEERYVSLLKEIISERQDFQSEVKKIEVLEKLTLEEFVKFYTDNFIEAGKKRRSVLISVLSTAENGAGMNVTESDAKLAAELTSSRLPIGSDVTVWKKRRTLLPIV